MSASWRGHVDVVDTLVQHGAKVDWKKEVNSYFYCTSIIYIATISQLSLQLRITICLFVIFAEKLSYFFPD